MDVGIERYVNSEEVQRSSIARTDTCEVAGGGGGGGAADSGRKRPSWKFDMLHRFIGL